MYNVQMVRQAGAAASVFTGLQGQLIVDMSLWTIRVHDGVTIGGYPLLNAVNNLSDLTDLSEAQDNLGLGTAAFVATTTFDAAGAASTAQTNAETFATAADVTVASNASSDATSKANTAQSNAETFATAADVTVLSSAETYADSAAATAQSNAESYADGTFPTKNGTGATGTWGVAISGNAATATAATNATNATNASVLKTADFQILEVSGTLRFMYGSTLIAVLNGTGDLRVIGNVSGGVSF